MRADLAIDAQWRESTKPGNNGGCVEFAQVGGYVAIRDSRDPGRKPPIFGADEWDCFLDGVTKGEFPVPEV
ncbi:DUF397 domain-containing protein [Actinoplanes hulinensis]|uniref:DUF397 domain-containing protein n=1 Tax=Actinoplanes hulinensis TaxID=1144547 RepID=A0ABS7AXD0_9ACTN|nr:DUF397 domain-containing protein [Actinoplanes hulinensis]MBW6433421.1 DUF397 domain-containing protein [Actinoplanes hulinensis]